MSAIAIEPIAEICASAKAAWQPLALASGEQRDRVLEQFLRLLAEHSDQLVALGSAETASNSHSDAHSLPLTTRRLRRAQTAVEHVVAAADPIGATLDESRLADGLTVRRESVPLGVIGYLCLGRPEATIEAIAACVKSANAIVLFGTGTTAPTDALLAELGARAARTAELPAACVSNIPDTSPAALSRFVTMSDSLDLIKQRGGAPLSSRLATVATVPLLYSVRSNCHVYVDRSADMQQATAVMLDAKAVRPDLCHSIETLLIHSDAVPRFLAPALKALATRNVALCLDQRAAEAAERDSVAFTPATEADWASEYLALTLAVKVVDSLEEAIGHIQRYGSGHSELILTDSLDSSRRFTREVDAACVYVNASTRYTTGPRLGLGPELGMSTQRLPVRGPIGLQQLCSYKYVIEGAGHTPPADDASW